MEITFDCLCECKVENLERLTVSLGGRIPKHKKHKARYGNAYVRELAREVLRRLHRDGRESSLANFAN